MMLSGNIAHLCHEIVSKHWTNKQIFWTLVNTQVKKNDRNSFNVKSEKFSQWFQRNWKFEKFTDRRLTTDDGQMLIRIALVFPYYTYARSL